MFRKAQKQSFYAVVITQGKVDKLHDVLHKISVLAFILFPMVQLIGVRKDAMNRSLHYAPYSANFADGDAYFAKGFATRVPTVIDDGD